MFKTQSIFAAHIFLILVAHSASDELSDTDMYHPSLQRLCKNQPYIGSLVTEKCFISMGFTFNPDDIAFNQVQERALLDWILSDKTQHKKAGKF